VLPNATRPNHGGNITRRAARADQLIDVTSQD